jgi:hypothetical protein
MEIKTKQVTEFGKSVTLYSVVNTTTGKGTLWHSSKEKALSHYNSSDWYSKPRRVA